MKKAVQALGLIFIISIIATPVHGRVFSNEDIVNAARAYLDIIDIREDYQERFEAADDPSVLEDLQMEANLRIMQALDDNGIDAETYNDLIDAAQEDDRLMEELLNEIDRQENIR